MINNWPRVPLYQRTPANLYAALLSRHLEQFVSYTYNLVPFRQILRCSAELYASTTISSWHVHQPECPSFQNHTNNVVSMALSYWQAYGWGG